MSPHQLNKELRDLWGAILVVLALMAWCKVEDIKQVQNLERQVDTLGKAVKAAHGEAKEAQRTQRNPYYLPDPLKVVKK